MKKIQKLRRMIQRKLREGIAILKDNSGLSVIEMLLILVEKFIPIIEYA